MSVSRTWIAASLLGLATAGCGRGGTDGAVAEQPPVALGAENIVVVDSALVESGPAVSGTLEADRAAVLRAQVSGTVSQLSAEEGQAVAQGAVLAHIEAPAIRDAELSARSGVRSAEMALDLAKRNYERSQRLAEAGAIADRDLEQSRSTMTGSEAMLADAQARLASAEQQLSYTEVRAPFGGIVSERPVHLGDVVQPGTMLLTVVDPSILRLEATVPVEQFSALKVGAPVEFSVAGFGARRFTGQIDRVNPAVDPATRQVRLYARIPNPGRGLVAGLYAEGRVATQSHQGLVIPFTALDTRGTQPGVMALRQGKVVLVPVELGLRDEVREAVEIVSGVTRGDTLLLGTAQAIAPGTAVAVTKVGED